MGFSEQVGLLQDHAKRVFGKPGLVRWKPAVGAAANIDGIFRDAHTGVELEAGEANVSTVAPILAIKRADIAADPVLRADQVEVPVGGVLYLVVDAQPDGEGMVDLHLHKVVVVP